MRIVDTLLRCSEAWWCKRISTCGISDGWMHWHDEVSTLVVHVILLTIRLRPRSLAMQNLWLYRSRIYQLTLEQLFVCIVRRYRFSPEKIAKHPTTI